MGTMLFKLSIQKMKQSLFIVCLLWAVSVSAQQTDSLQFEEIVVTASKIKTTARETTKPVIVIDEAEIQRSAAKDLSQLLNQQSGIMINGAFSNPGKDKAVYLRGAGTQYTVILIDGYPVSDPSSEGGAFDPRLISLNTIERIEVVKGSMSTLYGSDAIAGVINIITKKPTDPTAEVFGSASYGSYLNRDYSLGVRGRALNTGYSVSVSRQDVGGLSEAEEPAGSSGYNSDGFVRNGISANFEIPVVWGFKLEPLLSYSTYKGDYDNGAFADGDNTYEAVLLNVGSKFSYSSEKLGVQGAVTYTDTDRSFADDFGVFNPTAQLLNSDVYSTYKFSENIRVLAGLNHQKKEYQLTSSDTDAGSTILSPYTSVFLNTDFGLHSEFGIRLNNHSEYGSNLTYNIAPVFNFSSGFKVMASLSSGFKSPTLNELFGPFGSNPDLKPQESTSADLGLWWFLKELNTSVELQYFNRRIDDLIQYVGAGYTNVNKQLDQGVEAMVSFYHSNGKVSGYYNYLDGKIEENGVESENLIRRPNHSLGLISSYSVLESLEFAVDAQYVGEREDVFFNTSTFTNDPVTLDSYLLLNFSASYSLSGVKFFGELRNLLDSDYTEVYGYSTPGINGTLGVSFTF